MARIALAGFMHETNTFAPIKAGWDDFVRAEGLPGLTLGADMLTVLPPINIGSGGFIVEAQRLGHRLLPIGWCEAVPSAEVSDEAFENMARIICEGLRAATYDAVYLDLHGAMVTDSHQDGEGELLRRVRAVVGERTPVVVSLDLHANLSAAMLRLSQGLIAYRTYPHLDMADTGRRAARYLHDLLDAPGWPAKTRRALPFLIPLTGQCTMVEPSGGVYQKLAELEQTLPGLRSVSFTPGFPPADIHDCGPALVAYADEQAIAERAADELAGHILEREAEFVVPMLSATDAVARALAHDGPGPVVLADIQDNSGAGATSDTTGLLRAMLEQRVRDGVLGVLTDPEAAAAAHAAGPGAEIELAVGGKLYPPGGPPLQTRWTVAGLSDGRFRCTGPFYKNVEAALGPMAALRSGGVTVVISSGRMQAADQAMFRHIGVEPSAAKILGLKSTVHFRGDFTELADEILIVEAPGAFIDRPERLPYRRLRPGMRLGPLGPEHRPPANARQLTG